MGGAFQSGATTLGPKWSTPRSFAVCGGALRKVEALADAAVVVISKSAMRIFMVVVLSVRSMIVIEEPRLPVGVLTQFARQIKIEPRPAIETIGDAAHLLSGP
jgi:hypothetical protein